jgi:hypothetical protein
MNIFQRLGAGVGRGSVLGSAEHASQVADRYGLRRVRVRHSALTIVACAIIPPGDTVAGRLLYEVVWLPLSPFLFALARDHMGLARR